MAHARANRSDRRITAPTDNAAVPTADPKGSAFPRLCSFYAATYAALGIYMQFFPVWLHDVGGLSKAEVTQAQSGQIFARTIAGPLLSQRVDRNGRPTAMVVRLSLLSALAFAAFPFAHGLGPLFLCCVLYGSLYPPLHSVLDNLAIETARESGFRYTRIRVFGSISFLCVIVAGGFAFREWPSAAIYLVVLCLLSLSWVISWWLPRVERVPTVGGRAPVAQLLGDRKFFVFLLASGLLQGSHGGYYSLSTLHWRSHGIDSLEAGLLWAEGIVAEILLFFLARDSIERLRPTTLLLLGMAGAIVRWLALAWLVSPLAIAGVNWLHAVSFGVTYLGALQFLRRRVPSSLQATAQGLLGAFSSGVGMAVGTLLAGWAYDVEPGLAFVAMAALAVLGGLLALSLRRPRDEFLHDESQRDANANTPQRTATASPDAST